MEKRKRFQGLQLRVKRAHKGVELGIAERSELRPESIIAPESLHVLDSMK
jgi:hypothetical protein